MQQLSESEPEMSAGWNWMEVFEGTAIMLAAGVVTIMLPVDAIAVDLDRERSVCFVPRWPSGSYLEEVA